MRMVAAISGGLTVQVDWLGLELVCVLSNGAIVSDLG